jgi:monovalent cation:H+ antiporter-2, CPA2 family
VRIAKTHFPHLRILARAFEWNDAHVLLDAGVDHVYRQTLDTAVRAGTEALCMLGARAYTAQRAAQKFVRHDEASLHELTRSRITDRATYLSAVRQRIEDLEQLMLADRSDPELNRDAGWDAESLREESRRRAERGPVVGPLPDPQLPTA